MSFDFEITESEQVAASRLLTYRRPRVRATLAFFAAAAMLVTLWFGRSVIAGDESGSGPIVMSWICAFAAALAAHHGPVNTVRSLRLRSRAAAGPHHYTLSDSGLKMEAPGVTASYEWPNVIEVWETPEFLFFYTSAAWAQVLPKRAITAADLSTLRMELVRWVGSRARLMSPSAA